MSSAGGAARVRRVGAVLIVGAAGLSTAWAVAAERGASRTPPAAAKAPGGDAMQIEGIVGELDSAGCDKVLAAHQPEIKKCYEEVTERLFYLGGRMQLKLRIGASGLPHSVALVRSTVGSYEVEHCVTAAVQKMHFPPPKGGDGELTYPVEFAARTPVGAWAADKVAAEFKQAKFASCSGHKPKPGEHLATVHSMQATLYIGPGGKVTSVGFSAEEPIDDKLASCVANKVRALQLDDPLGRMVKVSCDLDGRGEGE